MFEIVIFQKSVQRSFFLVEYIIAFEKQDYLSNLIRDTKLPKYKG